MELFEQRYNKAKEMFESNGFYELRFSDLVNAIDMFGGGRTAEQLLDVAIKFYGVGFYMGTRFENNRRNKSKK